MKGPPRSHMDIHRQIKRSIVGFLSLALLGAAFLVPTFGQGESSVAAPASQSARVAASVREFAQFLQRDFQTIKNGLQSKTALDRMNAIPRLLQQLSTLAGHQDTLLQEADDLLDLRGDEYINLLGPIWQILTSLQEAKKLEIHVSSPKPGIEDRLTNKLLEVMEKSNNMWDIRQRQARERYAKDRKKRELAQQEVKKLEKQKQEESKRRFEEFQKAQKLYRSKEWTRHRVDWERKLKEDVNKEAKKAEDKIQQIKTLLGTSSTAQKRTKRDLSSSSTSSSPKANLDALLKQQTGQTEKTKEILDKVAQMKTMGCSPAVNLPPLPYVCSLKDKFLATSEKVQSLAKEVQSLKTELFQESYTDIPQKLRKAREDLQTLYPLVQDLVTLLDLWVKNNSEFTKPSLGGLYDKVKGILSELSDISSLSAKALLGAGGTDHERSLRRLWQKLFADAVKKLEQQVTDMGKKVPEAQAKAKARAKRSLPPAPATQARSASTIQSRSAAPTPRAQSPASSNAFAKERALLKTLEEELKTFPPGDPIIRAYQLQISRLKAKIGIS